MRHRFRARVWTRDQPAGWLFAALVAAVVTGYMVAHATASSHVALLAAIGAVVGLPIIARFLQRRFDPFEPIVVFAVAYGVMFFVRPLSMLTSEGLVYQRPTRTIDLDGSFDHMLLLALLGGIAFMGGYYAKAGRRWSSRLRGLPKDFDESSAVTAALVAASVGLLAFAGLFIVLGGGTAAFAALRNGRSPAVVEAVRSTTSYFVYVQWLLTPAALILIAVGTLRRHWSLIATGLTLAAFFIVVEAPLGNRMALLPLLGGLLVWHYVRQDKRPRLMVLLAVAALGLVASSIFLDTRESYRRQTPPLAQEVVTKLQNPDQIFDPLTKGADAEMAPAFAAALQVIPSEVPHTYGLGLVTDLLSRPIPRALWPGKPVPPREHLNQVLVPREPLVITANIEFSALLHFYLDWGVLGIAFGLAFYGALARAIYEYFIMHKRNVAVGVAYSVWLPFVVIALRDSPVDTLIRATFVILPVSVIFRFAGKRTGHRVKRGGLHMTDPRRPIEQAK